MIAEYDRLVGMSGPRTARERARAELLVEIKAEARRQLAAVGAAQLSLRAVARALEMVPSALYRYYPSREDLLTALIVDAYDSVGEHLEAAANRAPSGDHCARWMAACHALRTWALTHPHEYALIYGSAVPGYQAPEQTIASAVRTPFLLLGLVRDAWVAGQITWKEDENPRLSEAEAVNAVVLATNTGFDDVPADVLMRAVTAYTQLFGAVSLELFGHLRGAFEDNTVFFEHSVRLLAQVVGFTADSTHA